MEIQSLSVTQGEIRSALLTEEDVEEPDRSHHRMQTKCFTKSELVIIFDTVPGQNANWVILKHTIAPSVNYLE